MSVAGKSPAIVSSLLGLMGVGAFLLFYSFFFLFLFFLPCRWVVLPLTTLSSCPTLDPVARQAWPPLGWWDPDPPLWEECTVRRDSVCPNTPVTPEGSRDLRHDTSKG